MLFDQIKQLVCDPLIFAEYASKLKLRTYQQNVAWAVTRSVIAESGLSFVVLFPRQSGKNELQAQLETYLLTLYSQYDLDIVKISPTWKPQSVNAMSRIERVLSNNFLICDLWKRESGYIYRLGKARISFLSGGPTTHIVGATASLLLEVDEAQDITPEKYDKEIAPMAANTNATRIFWGTSWTSQTLLARELRASLRAQEKDGLQRVFMLNADQVSLEVPAYSKFVSEQIAKLGRNHPFIRTQYYCEEIDAQAGMFNPARLALMQGDQSAQAGPTSGQTYCFLLDLAGQDESRMNLDASAPLSNPGRDSVSLTIASIDLSSLVTLQAPTYRLVNRMQWTGQNHLVIFGKLKSLIESWRPQYIVMDATGVGEGMWALLDKSFPGRVIPVKFSQQVKSELGWRYLAIVETGRLRDCCLTDPVLAQYLACQAEILPGPAKTLRWGVPEGTRGPDGELVHDDYLLADALVSELDRLDWSITTESVTVTSVDPLLAMERNF